jgi:hypothetical protein
MTYTQKTKVWKRVYTVQRKHTHTHTHTHTNALLFKQQYLHKCARTCMVFYMHTSLSPRLLLSDSTFVRPIPSPTHRARSMLYGLKLLRSITNAPWAQATQKHHKCSMGSSYSEASHAYMHCAGPTLFDEVVLGPVDGRCGHDCLEMQAVVSKLQQHVPRYCICACQNVCVIAILCDK